MPWPGNSSARRLPRMLADLATAAAVGALLAYLALGLVSDARPGGRWILRHWWALGILVTGGLALGLHGLSGRRPDLVRRLRPVALASLATALALLAADSVFHGYEIRTGRRRMADFSTDVETRRLAGAVVRYYPTAWNFERYRPDVVASGHRYGDLYSPRLLRCPDLADTVPERRFVTYRIDAHGFRETTPLAQARIFALGDSFVTGPTRQDRLWVKELERRLGEPTYSLGVNAASPRQELLLLRSLLESGSPPLVRHLLWMIFEGNDLEDSYEDHRPPGAAEGPVSPNPFALAPWLGRRLGAEIHERSLLRRLVRGDLILGSSPGSGAARTACGGPGWIYHSRRLGFKAFHPEYVRRAGLPRSYVDTHPNRPRLDATMRDMQALARRFHFEVSVLIAPSGARLHGPYFDGFPAISPEPYFIDHVEGVARRLGFRVLNLYPLLRERAARELLYYRDDTHWNERGHQLVAALIAIHLFGRS